MLAIIRGKEVGEGGAGVTSYWEAISLLYLLGEQLRFRAEDAIDRCCGLVSEFKACHCQGFVILVVIHWISNAFSTYSVMRHDPT